MNLNISLSQTFVGFLFNPFQPRLDRDAAAEGGGEGAADVEEEAENSDDYEDIDEETDEDLHPNEDGDFGSNESLPSLD